MELAFFDGYQEVIEGLALDRTYPCTNKELCG